MSYTPLTLDELDNFEKLLSIKIQEGIVDFEIKNVEENKTKAGLDCLILNLKCSDKQGDSDFCRAWLIIDNYENDRQNKFNQRKLRQFAESIGNVNLYTEAKLNPQNIINKCGKAKAKYETTDNGRTFLNIKYWISKDYKEKIKNQSSEPIEDDDLPF